MSIRSQMIVRPHYPETDGLPMGENTLQFQWIVTIKEGLDIVFRHDPQVFVAGDLFWYPVEGNPRIRAAPDTMVAFGVPKGHRRSYLQWEEDGISPQVVFEVQSPSNSHLDLQQGFEFYERYGVEEYYLYDPDQVKLLGWLRQKGCLEPIPNMNGWVSPRLGVRFDLSGDDLRLIGPDGKPFATYAELYEREEQAIDQMLIARGEAEAERKRAERLAAQLRKLGIEPEA
jgi:Uma2 family endonuclease